MKLSQAFQPPLPCPHLYSISIPYLFDWIGDYDFQEHLEQGKLSCRHCTTKHKQQLWACLTTGCTEICCMKHISRHFVETNDGKSDHITFGNSFESCSDEHSIIMNLFTGSLYCLKCEKEICSYEYDDVEIFELVHKIRSCLTNPVDLDEEFMTEARQQRIEERIERKKQEEIKKEEEKKERKRQKVEAKKAERRDNRSKKRQIIKKITTSNPLIMPPQDKFRAESRVTTGSLMLKHGRRGTPNQRYIFVTKEMDSICWRDPRGTKIKGSIDVADIVEVLEGQQTKVFARNSGRPNREEYSFSIIGTNRTLDLEAATKNQAREWISSLRYLMAKNDPTKQKEAEEFGKNNPGGVTALIEKIDAEELNDDIVSNFSGLSSDDIVQKAKNASMVVNNESFFEEMENYHDAKFEEEE
ncbi:hypothetical protein PCE1_000919 [Barthelona sp. PCE]